jgi:hypothetical protein
MQSPLEPASLRSAVPSPRTTLTASSSETVAPLTEADVDGSAIYSPNRTELRVLNRTDFQYEESRW